MQMKVTSSKLLLLLAFLVPFFALQAQVSYSDTIGEGSTQTSNISVLPGYYGFHRSATLYTAAEINHGSGNIQSLSYQIAIGNYPMDDSDKQLKIYLLETAATALDLSQTWQSLTATATLVYDSTGFTVDWDEYWKEFLFTQAFSYNGGNLIVLVDGTACDPAPSMGDCETDVYINNGNASNCWIRLQDVNPISDTVVLSSIPAGTHGNSSDRPNVFFTFNGSHEADTNCIITLPYIEDFENYPGDYSAIPTCWNTISNEYNSFYNSYYPIINSGSQSDNYNQTMMFILMNSYAQYAVLPAVDSALSMQNISMTFQFKSAQQNTTRMVVGVMSAPDDTLSFVPVATVWREGSSNAWENKEINFATYSGTGKHIAFLFSKANSSSMYPSCFVDNIMVFATPDCTPPVQISAHAGSDTTTISWTLTNNAYGVRLYYKAATDSLYDSVEVFGDQYYELYNLPVNTVYDYYLVTICNDYSESDASDVLTFATPCAEVTTFPWMENFENGINCWTLNASVAGQDWQLVTSGNYPTCAPTSGNYMMKYNCWNFNADSWATMSSPAIVTNQAMNLSFKYHKYGPQEAWDYTTMQSHPANDRVEVYLNSTPALDGAILLTTVNGYDVSYVGWDSTSVNIPAQASEYYLIFKAISDYGYNLYVDDIKLDYAQEDTIEQIVYVTIDTAICEGAALYLYNNTYSEEGTYTITLEDSVITINLTLNTSYSIVINDSIVEGNTYTNYGFNVSTAGTYTQNLTTVNGCDSTVTLYLSVMSGVGNYATTNFSISPNPAIDYFQVTMQPSREPVVLELMDISGRVVRTARLMPGETSLKMERSTLHSGVYMLRLTSDGKAQTRKVVFR